MPQKNLIWRHKQELFSSPILFHLREIALVPLSLSLSPFSLPSSFPSCLPLDPFSFSRAFSSSVLPWFLYSLSPAVSLFLLPSLSVSFRLLLISLSLPFSLPHSHVAYHAYILRHMKACIVRCISIHGNQ